MTDYSNTQELSEFMHSHKLIQGNGHLHFIVLVSVTTEHNKIRHKKMEIRVKFDGFDNLGRLNLDESVLNPSEYPTNHDAKYQTFKHVDNEYLLITGIHKKNPMIGKFEVQIYPLKDN
jgi:hypothetical protein